MDLSIIIVSWNARELLLKCLETLDRETASHRAEIIVVDNDSQDGSPEAVKQSYPHVRLIRNEINLGFGRANNIGIVHSTGRYLCLINSDVKVLHGCIDQMFEYMEGHPAVGILGPKILNADGTLQPSCKRFPTVWNSFCRALALDTFFQKYRRLRRELMTFPHETARAVDILSGCFWFLRREALNRVGLFDERFFIYAEDNDLCKRFWDAGWEVVYYPKALAIHYGGASSGNAPIRFYVEMHRANFQYCKKHHGPASQTCFLLTAVLHQVVRIIRGALISSFRPSKRAAMIPKINRSVACLLWLVGGKT